MDGGSAVHLRHVYRLSFNLFSMSLYILYFYMLDTREERMDSNTKHFQQK